MGTGISSALRPAPPDLLLVPHPDAISQLDGTDDAEVDWDVDWDIDDLT